MNHYEEFYKQYNELQRKYLKVVENRRMWVEYARAASRSLRRKRKRLERLEAIVRQRRASLHRDRCQRRRLFLRQRRPRT